MPASKAKTKAPKPNSGTPASNPKNKAPTGVAKAPKMPFNGKVSSSGNKYLAKVSAGTGRDGFRDAFKKIVDQVYHPRFKPKSNAVFNIVAAGLDRCHRLSYHSMRKTLVSYLDGSITQKQLDTMAYAVIGGEQSAVAAWPKLSQSMQQEQQNLNATYPTQLAAQTQAASTIKVVNSTMNFLNNRIENVTLGNSTINRSVGEKNDFNFELNKQNKQSLTPKSRRHAETQFKDPKQLRAISRAATPNGVAVWSSHINGGQGGQVLEQQMSPKTQRYIRAMPSK
ncbi:MAG: hypothetical protein AB8B85_12955 [Paracoccaceae bacterium]